MSISIDLSKEKLILHVLITPNRLHAVATILGLAIWICIDPLEYFSNLISFLSRMSYYLEEHEKCLKIFLY